MSTAPQSSVEYLIEAVKQAEAELESTALAAAAIRKRYGIACARLDRLRRAVAILTGGEG